MVAANHPGYTSGNATPSSVLRAWEQPRDATFLLGEMLESRFKDYVDRSRIYAIGYSLGGYSALALAGARLDMHRYIEFCGSNEDVSCRYFKPAFSSLSDADFKNAAMDLKDERFTGIIALAPGFVESVTQESLSRIMVPTLIVGASLDKNVPPATHLLPWRENFSELMRYEEIPDAAHFSFMQICKPNGAAILAEEGAEFVCQDGNGSSRRDIHETLYTLIVDFLRPTTN